ncbi:MAG: ABC transporter substrate-binding protein [Firmicutes bacterium]|nr:ABC transporter substrate-binding protein [Bacillota bacterium]
MKKRILAMALAALMILSLAGCGGSGAQGQETQDLEKITFVLDWTPNTNHTGLYVAQANGYYEEAGLEVEIVQPTEDGAALMVASGAADFGIACQDTMEPSIVGENALPIKAVAAILQHNTSGIISLKETGIDRPANMAGHNYATWQMPVEQAMIKSIVEQDGGSFEDVKMIPSTVYDVITGLNSGVDAIWVFYGWDGIATELKGIETNWLDFGKIDSVFDYYTPVIISNDTYLEEKGDLAKKFLEATAKGYEFAIENPEEAADILLAAAPELDEEIVKASQIWLADQYKAEVDRWGYIDPTRWDRFYQWLNDNNLSEAPIAPGTGFTNDYLPE